MMTTSQMGILAFMQALRIGAEAWERYERGELSEAQLEAEIDKMQARLSDTRTRLKELIAEKQSTRK